MRKGDLVEYIKRSHWGGTSRSGIIGVLLKRTYQGYDPENSKWDVLLNGDIISLTGKQVRAMYLPVHSDC